MTSLDTWWLGSASVALVLTFCRFPWALVSVFMVPPFFWARVGDGLLARLAGFLGFASPGHDLRFRWVATDGGLVRVLDFQPIGAENASATVVIAPDGPNVIEHHLASIGALQAAFPALRVVCFDFPGFGGSRPAMLYGHTLDEGARVTEQVLDAMGVDCAVLAFSCANGLYAVRLAQTSPARIRALLLSQTPSLEAMARWSESAVPKTLRVPLLGQLLGWLGRWRLAAVWYRMALPRGSPLVDPMRAQAHASLDHGGCFCLASVVQGLAREPASVSRVPPPRVPAVVLWGARDFSHRSTNAGQAVAQLLPHARLVELAECGHFPELEHATALRDALAEILAR